MGIAHTFFSYLFSVLLEGPGEEAAACVAIYLSSSPSWWFPGTAKQLGYPWALPGSCCTDLQSLMQPTHACTNTCWPNEEVAFVTEPQQCLSNLYLLESSPPRSLFPTTPHNFPVWLFFSTSQEG